MKCTRSIFANALIVAILVFGGAVETASARGILNPWSWFGSSKKDEPDEEVAPAVDIETEVESLQRNLADKEDLLRRVTVERDELVRRDSVRTAVACIAVILAFGMGAVAALSRHHLSCLPKKFKQYFGGRTPSSVRFSAQGNPNKCPQCGAIRPESQGRCPKCSLRF
jgi:hypothetical protein